MSKGWLAALGAAFFVALWWITRPKVSTGPSVSSVPTRGPTMTPNSNANSAIVSTGKGGLLSTGVSTGKGGLLGTDAETLAVGVGIAGGLSAVGMPIPASALVARTVAVPTTLVLNGLVNQTGIGFLKNSPPVVKGAVAVSALPFVAAADAVNWTGQFLDLW